MLSPIITYKNATVLRPILSSDRLICHYKIDGQILTNTYELPEGIIDSRINDEESQKMSEWVAIASSFGLFSLGYINNLICDFPITKADIKFFEKLFYLGFGEFKLTNNIPLQTRTNISSSYKANINPPIYKDEQSRDGSNRILLLNGGGKDGSVSAYLLDKNSLDFTWFQRGNSVAQQKVVNVWDKPLLSIKRNLDPNRKSGPYSGHRPMSAGIAFLSTLCAHLYGYDYVISSNESSANEGNITVDGFTVNHQYSKSLEFEMDIQNLLTSSGINDVVYFSLLRPLNELQIASFTKYLSNQQLAAITSCNHGTSTGTWCLDCPKCAFIILVIYASNLSAALDIWNDNKIINKPTLRRHLVDLLDPTKSKPLECVGTLDECQMAAGLILQNDITYQFLDKPTKELLEKFKPNTPTNGVPFDISEHKIPKDFTVVVDSIVDSLKPL